jgi:hypothetical protein
MLAKTGPGLRFNEHLEGDGPTVFAHACKRPAEQGNGRPAWGTNAGQKFRGSLPVRRHEKATARQDQAGQTSSGDGTGDGALRISDCPEVIY